MRLSKDVISIPFLAWYVILKLVARS